MWPEAILRLGAVEYGKTLERFFTNRVVYSEGRFKRITLHTLLKINCRDTFGKQKKNIS